MKKYIKLLSLCFLVSTGLSSCEPAEDDIRPAPRDLGGYAYLTDRLISQFDQNEELNLELFTADDVEIESIEILRGGEVLGSATVSGETASFNASILGDLAPGNTYKLRIRSNLSNGKVAEDPFTVTVADAITLDEVPNEARFLDPSLNVISYSTFSRFASVDKVELFVKGDRNAAFSLVADDLDLASGVVDLGQFDYEAFDVTPGDTIFFRFVAQSGGINEEVVAEIPVVSQDFEGSQAATLSNDPAMDSFRLETGEFVEDAEAEMLFMGPLGFETQNGVSFVQTTVPNDMTAAEFFAETDLMEAETIFNQGTPMTSITDVEADDVFIYRAERTDEDGQMVEFFGIVKIGDTTVRNAVDESFDFEFTEGTILRQ